MNSDFNKDRLNKLINEISPKNILIHKDHMKNLNYFIENPSATSCIKTSDLRYTQGENRECEKYDLVIYIADSYEPQEIILKTINEYIKNNSLIFIGEMKSAKSILKKYDCQKKFHTGKFFVGYIKQQDSDNIKIEQHKINETLKDVNITFQTEKGLFSYKKIDEGTKFLLENIDIKEEDEVLDFACGYGAIGLMYAKKYPKSKIVMTDSKIKAIQYAKTNAKLNNTQNVEIKNVYLLRGIEGKYDKIISNPPTHMKLYEVEDLIKKFKELLKDKGETFLIINKIVDYERYAKKYFKEITIENQNEQYKIIKLKK